MKILNDAFPPVTELTPFSSDINSSFVSVFDGNFDDMVLNTFKKVSQTDTQFKNAIDSMSHAANFDSNPQRLIELQQYIGEYTNYVSLVSALARKGVSTIETLEKSQ